MNATPKRKRKPPLVSWWREAAAMPLRSFKVSSSRSGPDQLLEYTLEEDGELVGRWKHADVPWLSAWLHDHLMRLFGAWHVARSEVQALHGKKTGGINSAKRRSGPNSKAAKIREKAAEYIKRGRDPLGSNRTLNAIAGHAGCTIRYVKIVLVEGGDKKTRK